MKFIREQPIESVSYFGVIPNLSRAHEAIVWLAFEMMARQLAKWKAAFETVLDIRASHPTNPFLEKYLFARAFEIDKQLGSNEEPVFWPLTDHIANMGEMVTKFASQLKPVTPKACFMQIEYVHFLHSLTTMGLISPNKCGKFRTMPVHISGNHDLMFPAPILIPGLMQELCGQFPTLATRFLPQQMQQFQAAFPTFVTNTGEYDAILFSAMLSHDFVRIHPYADGNGRVSRLLMNLVLYGHHPPVYLKADKKGRHRYIQALRRGDNRKIKPLACLIAMSLKETYRSLLKSVGI